MNRRHFLQGMLAGAAGLTVPGLRPTQAQSRPNVLFIAVDDLNTWTGCLGGHPDAQTPNLDRLAARGMLFTHAYCPAPICNASRTAVLTGLRSSTSGVYWNSAQRQHFRRFPQTAEHITLPQHFMQHGYRTLRAGKVFHYDDPASWDEVYDAERIAGIDSFDRAHPAHNGIAGLPEELDWGPLDLSDEDLTDWQVVNWAAERLDRGFDQPFFMGVGLYRPHLPWFVPRAYFELFPPEAVALPEVLPHDRDDVPAIAVDNVFERANTHQVIVEAGAWHTAVAAYLASITFFDERLGQLLAALDASAYADHTVIVLWSDHGWHLGEKQYWSKDVLWEEALHIPLIITAPESASIPVAPGSQCARVVSTLDLYPTLAEVCGLPPRGGLDGVSLGPLLQNPDADWDRPAISTRDYMNHSIRTAQWRYTRYVDDSEELYDHVTDPLEWHNLAGDSQYDDVKAALARYLPEVNLPSVPKPANQSDD
ncbi:MAG: sulfatase [Anaerolineae bacterium]|nr:sulfatase [Anaerolineae bacterium]